MSLPSLRFAPEVQTARQQGRPLVALESTVISHGLPWPHNFELAQRLEAVVREAGAVPATIALLDGEIRIGLDQAELEHLARAPGILKISRRDYAVALAGRRDGATTVAGTLMAAYWAGIPVFATGGIGGVHRGAEEHFDVSQDLGAIARHPVAVVCAGAKSVLDLPRTLEVLEALAVPVLGYGTNVLPAFYAADSGLALEHRVDDAAAAARVLRARFGDLGQGGVVIAVPPPADAALDSRAVERHLRAALRAAARRGVRGKAVTPFLLADLGRRTRGASVQANLALLEQNARVAGRIAVALRRGR